MTVVWCGGCCTLQLSRSCLSLETDLGEKRSFAERRGAASKVQKYWGAASEVQKSCQLGERCSEGFLFPEAWPTCPTCPEREASSPLRGLPRLLLPPCPAPPPGQILRTHSHWIPGTSWCNLVTKSSQSLCVSFCFPAPWVGVLKDWVWLLSGDLASQATPVGPML